MSGLRKICKPMNLHQHEKSCPSRKLPEQWSAEVPKPLPSPQASYANARLQSAGFPSQPSGCSSLRRTREKDALTTDGDTNKPLLHDNNRNRSLGKRALASSPSSSSSSSLPNDNDAESTEASEKYSSDNDQDCSKAEYPEQEQGARTRNSKKKVSARNPPVSQNVMLQTGLPCQALPSHPQHPQMSQCFPQLQRQPQSQLPLSAAYPQGIPYPPQQSFFAPPQSSFPLNVQHQIDSCCFHKLHSSQLRCALYSQRTTRSPQQAKPLQMLNNVHSPLPSQMQSGSQLPQNTNVPPVNYLPQAYQTLQASFSPFPSNPMHSAPSLCDIANRPDNCAGSFLTQNPVPPFSSNIDPPFKRVKPDQIPQSSTLKVQGTRKVLDNHQALGCVLSKESAHQASCFECGNLPREKYKSDKFYFNEEKNCVIKVVENSPLKQVHSDHHGPGQAVVESNRHTCPEATLAAIYKQNEKILNLLNIQLEMEGSETCSDNFQNVQIENRAAESQIMQPEQNGQDETVHLGAAAVQSNNEKPREDQASQPGSKQSDPELNVEFFDNLTKVPMNKAKNKDGTRVTEAKKLACSAEGCLLRATMDRSCFFAHVWGLAVKNKPKGVPFKSGSFLGSFISAYLNNCQGKSSFYLTNEEYFGVFFLPVMQNVMKHADQYLYEKHLTEFFEVNKDYIVREMRLYFKNNLRHRKIDVLDAYKSKIGARAASKLFATAGAINDGDYRRLRKNPVGNKLFVESVKKAFSLEKRSVSLEQLAFASISIIDEYSSKTKDGAIPTLYRLVPRFTRQTEEKVARHYLMCASLASQLTNCGASTDYGWKTDDFDIHHGGEKNFDVLLKYIHKLGDNFV